MHIGHYREAVPRQPSFCVELDFSANDFQQEWKRCNMVANYIAEYTAYEFDRREQAENLISTVLNEMLESSVRLTPENSDLQISLRHIGDQLFFEVEHSLNPQNQEEYVKFLERVCQGDVDDLYLKLLTDEDPTPQNTQQLGLVVLVHDFSATIAARIENGRIRTQVTIPTQEVAA